jgi:hypothetical protein
MADSRIIMCNAGPDMGGRASSFGRIGGCRSRIVTCDASGGARATHTLPFRLQVLRQIRRDIGFGKVQAIHFIEFIGDFDQCDAASEFVAELFKYRNDCVFQFVIV